MISNNMQPQRYRADIDGLRGIAVTAVVLFHATVPLLAGGFTGVDIFFVISGYLIGGHIDDDLTRNRFSFAKFYQRRTKRILPALFVVLAFVLICGALLLSPDEYKSLSWSSFAATASASNAFFWKTGDYFGTSADEKPLLMTWSLGVEEQFYLVIPLLMVVLSRLRRRVLIGSLFVITVASFFLSLYQSVHAPTAAFYLLPSRVWELGAGVLLATCRSRETVSSRQPSKAIFNVLSTIGLIGILLPIVLLRSTVPFPGPWALPTVAGSVLLLAATGSWINKNLLALAPLVTIGRVSYSFYLWHWPILAFLRISLGGHLPLAWGLIAVGVAFGISFASYYLIEQPFRQSQVGPKVLLLRYGALSALITTVTLVISLSRGFPQRFPSGFAATTERQHDIVSRDQCLMRDGSVTPSQAPSCIGGNNSELVALWGDSHAAALAPALATLASRQGYSVAEFTKVVCPPLMGVGRSYRESPNRTRECAAFNNNVLRKIISEPRIKIVVLTAYWEAPFDPNSDQGKLATAGGSGLLVPHGDEAKILFRDSLLKSIAAIEASGRRVMVIGDVPTFSVDPVARMWTSRIALRRRLAEYISHQDISKIDFGRVTPADLTREQIESRALLRSTVLSSDGVSFWDPFVPLCQGTTSCLYRIAGVPLYVDTNHVSLEGGLKALDGWSINETQSAKDSAQVLRSQPL